MSIVASGFSTAATPSSTVLAPAPAGVAVGDLLLIYALTTTAATFTSTGWTAVTAGTGQNIAGQLLWKTAASADVTLSSSAGSYTVTCSASHSVAGIIADLPGSGFDPAAPSSSGQFLAGTATSFPVTGVTTLAAADLLLWFGGSRVASGASNTVTPPAGFTTSVAQVNTSTATVNVGVMLAIATQATAGATGTETGTLGFSGDGGGLLIAVNQGAAIAAPPALTPAAAFPAPGLVTASAMTAPPFQVTAAFPAPGVTLNAIAATPVLSGGVSFPALGIMSVLAVTLPAAASFPASGVQADQAVTSPVFTAPAAFAGPSFTAAALLRTGTLTTAAGFQAPPAAAQSAAVTAPPLTIAASFPAPFTGARWMTTGQILDLLYAYDPATTTALFNMPAAFAIGLATTSTTTAPFTSPLATTPVLKYSSLARFQADLAAGAITYPYQWLIYDCEYWGGSGQTPAAEYTSPVVSMQAFCALAHANGYKVMLTPGRDLAQAPGSAVLPAYTGGTLDAWYEAANIAGLCVAAGADAYEIQTQADTLSPANFTSFWATASAQANAANPACPVFAGISVTYGTGTQMAAAALSIPAANGYWLNGTIPTTATSVLAMRTWLGTHTGNVADPTLVSAVSFSAPVTADSVVTTAVLSAGAAFPAPGVQADGTASAMAFTSPPVFPWLTIGLIGNTGTVVFTAGPGPSRWTAAPAPPRWKASPS